MSISSIGGSPAAITLASAPSASSAATTLAALSGVDGAVLANVDAASSGVSAALQDLSSALGSVIDTTA